MEASGKNNASAAMKLRQDFGIDFPLQAAECVANFSPPRKRNNRGTGAP
jgi:hypothetical protein